MMDATRSRSKTRIIVTFAVTFAGLLFGMGPAAAGNAGGQTTFRVQGTQVVVDPTTGQSRMLADPDSGRPGLVGDWYYTRWDEQYSSPTLYIATGSERFSGCIEVNHTAGCQSDEPAGELTFDFAYWARFDPNGAFLGGRCVHPITGGTASFAGARGLLSMTDTPTAAGIVTTYTGTVVTIAKLPASTSGQRTSADSDATGASVAASAAAIDRPAIGC